MLLVWMFGQLCDLLDGAVAREWALRMGKVPCWIPWPIWFLLVLAPAFVGMALMMEWQAIGFFPEGLGRSPCCLYWWSWQRLGGLARFSLESTSERQA